MFSEIFFYCCKQTLRGPCQKPLKLVHLHSIFQDETQNAFFLVKNNSKHSKCDWQRPYHDEEAFVLWQTSEICHRMLNTPNNADYGPVCHNLMDCPAPPIPIPNSDLIWHCRGGLLVPWQTFHRFEKLSLNLLSQWGHIITSVYMALLC